MGGQDQLSVLQCSEFDDGSNKQLSKFEKSENFNFMISDISESINESIERLTSGDFDLISCSGIAWNNYSESKDQLAVVAVLPRRDASWVIVSEDNLYYLIKDAKIVCNSELITRQLKRARPDLEIINFGTWNKENKTDYNSMKILNNLEESRRSGIIQGYAISRSDWESSGIKARRHTLGMYKSEKNDSRFTPPPLHGFCLLVSRLGFPNNLVDGINDITSQNIFFLESMLESNMDPKVKGIIGIHVAQRRIGSLLKQAKTDDDLTLKSSTVSPEGDIESVQTRFEVIIELPDVEGKFTLVLERITPLESANYLSHIIMGDWNELYRVAIGNDSADNGNTRLF